MWAAGLPLRDGPLVPPPVSPMPDLQPHAGTYVLVLRSTQHAHCVVGRWGTLEIRPGYYLYVGSAFGAGGVRARVARHCRQHKTQRWHIDYLRAFTAPHSVWCSYAATRLEHHWARALSALPDVAAVDGFGCSDCRCNAHLFFAERAPRRAAFIAQVGGSVETCRCQKAD